MVGHGASTSEKHGSLCSRYGPGALGDPVREQGGLFQGAALGLRSGRRPQICWRHRASLCKVKVLLQRKLHLRVHNGTWLNVTRSKPVCVCKLHLPDWLPCTHQQKPRKLHLFPRRVRHARRPLGGLQLSQPALHRPSTCSFLLWN